jgi:hypothetical protein
VVSLGRFCWRQASTVRSLSFITDRQYFWTSCAQAFCSSGVPERCWGGVGSAMAPVEADSDKRVATKKYLRIVFLCPQNRRIRTRFAWASPGRLFRMTCATNRTDQCSKSAGKCGQICGDPAMFTRIAETGAATPITNCYQRIFSREISAWQAHDTRSFGGFSSDKVPLPARPSHFLAK